MHVDILVRKDSVSEQVRAQARAKMARLGRRNPVLERAEVRLSEDPDAPTATRKVCEIVLTGHGHTVRARAASHDLQYALEKVVPKLEHQVERLKGKLVSRSHPRRSGAMA